jgi:NHL repeat
MTGRQPPSNGKMWPVGRRGPWRLVLGASLALTTVAVALSPAAGAARRAAVAVPVRTLLAGGTLDAPGALALDAAGDVFVADTGHCRVVEIPARSGRDYGVTLQRGHAVTVAGGRCGHGRIGHPTGLAVDVTGDVYLAEANDQRVQVLEPSGAIVTVAGTGVAGNGGHGGVATSAQLDEPTAVAVDRSGDVFIADTANCEVQVVAVADGQVLGQAVERDHLTTVAGTGVCGTAGQGGPLGGAQLFDPVALAVDFAGDLLVADQGDQSVLVATAQGGTYYGTAIGAGDIGVVVGGTGSYGPYLADGLSATSVGAELNDPRGLALGPTGSLVISDGFMHVIRIVPARSGPQFGRTMTADDLYTVAGALPGVTAAGAGDGTRWVLTKMGTPTGVAVTTGGALVYCDAATGAVVKIG